MATIQFEDGTKVNFDGNPTPEDVAFVAQQLGIKAQSKSEPTPKSLASRVGSVGKAVVDAFLPSFSEAGKQLAGRLEAPRIAESSALGASQMPSILKNLQNPNATPESKAKIIKMASEANIQIPEELSRTIQQALGSGVVTTATVLDYGAAAKGITSGLKALGLKKGVQTLGAVGAGVGGGFAVDVGLNMQEGKTGLGALKPGLGTVIGAAIPGAGAAIGGIRTALKDTAPTLINSLIKPLQKGFAYGKDPGRTVSELGITANSLEELATNIGTARNTIGEKLSQYSKFIPEKYTLNASEALAPFDEAIKAAVSKNNQTLYNRLQQTKQAITNVFSTSLGAITPVGSRLLDNLTYDQGVQIKRLIGDLTEWTGKQTEDESVNGALTRMYGALKGKLDELANKANPEIAAELKKLNRQYADLTSAEVATKYRDVLQKRQNLVNLPGKIGLVGAALTAPFTGGVTAVIAAIASIGIDKALSSPAFKTRLAAWLAKAPPKQVQELFKRFPILQGEFPGDTFMKTKLGQQTSEYLKNVKPGLVIEDVSGIPKELQPLAQEAKKYKSAEEFVNKNIFFRGEGGNNVAQGKTVLAKGKHFALGDEKYASGFGETKSYTIKPDAKVFDASGMDFPDIQKALGLPVQGKFAYISPDNFTKALKENGYDILKYDGTLKSDGRPFVHIVEVSPNSLVETSKSQLTDLWNKVQGGTPQAFQGFSDLSTKLLEKLKGRTTVSKQFISDLTNSPDLKQPERDLIRNLLEGEGKDVSVPDFANKVKSELLPLDRKLAFNDGGGRYENINLPDELRGPVASYNEHVYTSPIKTSAGSVHFGGVRESVGQNYFAHTRIEDLPATGQKGRVIPPRNMSPEGQDAFNKRASELASGGTTRRVIEIQSDLFQKGRLESEAYNNDFGRPLFKKNGVDVTATSQLKKGDIVEGSGAKFEVVKRIDEDYVLGKRLDGYANGREQEINILSGGDKTQRARLEAANKSRADELAKLEPYRNTWHERVIREEVKQAAKDGKTKLQFPTGETAMKIEGMTNEFPWFDPLSSVNYRIKPSDLKAGAVIKQGFGGPNWYIVKPLGDGKFKAVLESTYKDSQKLPTSQRNEYLFNSSETFDISGKVDTNNPIYKFYEKEVGKYLKNKYGAELVTDPQGVKWWEVKVTPEMKKLPIEAFGAGLIPLGATQKDKNQKQPTRLGQPK